MAMTQDSPLEGLSRAELRALARDFIGDGVDGSLREFTHTTLEEFLEYDVGIPPPRIAPNDGQTNKGKRLFQTLEDVAPALQRRAVTLLLERVRTRPRDEKQAAARRTLEAAVQRLDGNTPVLHVPAESGADVLKSLEEAQTLLREHGPTAALDRVHTALHGYLRDICQAKGMPEAQSANVQRLYKWMVASLPEYALDSEQGNLQERIGNNLTGALEAANIFRNNWSRAHPNDEPDRRLAAFVIDLAWVVMRDADRRFSEASST